MHASTLCSPGEFNLSSPVLVIQINATGRVKLPDNGTVSMVFKMPEVYQLQSLCLKRACTKLCIHAYFLLFIMIHKYIPYHSKGNITLACQLHTCILNA